MKNKGFTLTELLVTLVVLGIITAIAIPNIGGILEDNRRSVAVEDANKMYETVKSLEATKKIEKPKENDHCTVVTLSFLDQDDNFKTTANNTTYEKDKSFVVTKRTTSGTTVKYEYYIRLIEQSDTEFTEGIDLANYSDLSKNKYNTAIITNEIKEVDSSETLGKLRDSGGSIKCGEIDKIY